ncbi:MAG TPA: hypothetical protein VFN10_19490 [Thermoanaerobaculia bacterium]|nr:hypothetical protein [Thermoanaerobaculia bacterium]
MIDLLTALTPDTIHVGYDPDTGRAVHVPRRHLERGVSLVGAVGVGKTDLVAECLRAMAFSGASWCYLDFAGSGFAAAARFDALAATLLGLGVEALYADTVPEAAGIAGRFMRRHAYVTVGEDDPPVRLNILRRLRRRDGRRETPQRVAGRFADVWAVQYSKDADIRVRFAKWCTVAAALLSAADRPITEYHLLFEDPMYRGFLRRAQIAAKTAGDPFVREQWQILDSQFLALAKTPGERLNRAQLEELGSLHNSLGPLRCGPMAAFFGGNENLKLEEVAYGDRRLYLSTTALANIQHRKFVHRSVWAALDGLIHEIGQDEERPVGFAIFDEVAPLTESHFDSFAQLRNHKFSPWILRQTHEAQFEMMGMAAAASVVEQCLRYQIYWRPETEAFARRIATRGPIPDYQEEIVTLVSRSTGWSRSRAGSAAASWVASFDPETTRPETRSIGDSAGEVESEGETETEHRIGVDEILLHRTLGHLHLPAYHAVHIHEDQARTIQHVRARQLPRTLFGVDHVARYLSQVRRLHDRDATPFAPYDPTVCIVPDAPAAATPPGATKPYQPGARGEKATAPA